MSDSLIVCDNFINGAYAPPKGGEYMGVDAPATGKDVDAAVEAAKKALPEWQDLTVKARASIMFRFHHLLQAHADELADLVVMENGKTKAEALASVAKGNETVEWACSMPQLMPGQHLRVSRGVTCHEVREPLGIVGSVFPFNFPVMVPMWTSPIALVAGNCVIAKASEKVPLTMRRVCELMHEAGVPPGVFQLVHGAVPVVNALCDHPDISAVSFVGSSRVAELVANQCHAKNKRVLALGGAKNHLVALPDCDVDMAASDIVASFAGCAGQRCMAASALLLVGDQPALLQAVCAKAAALEPGQGKGQIGPVIDDAAKTRILRYINEAEARGAKVLVDGRSWAGQLPGTWVGPTVLHVSDAKDAAMQDEIFGPVLTVYTCKNGEEAVQIENDSPYGNAAAVYTQSGASAEFYTPKFRAAMIGVNIGIPVPREPFSFGGLYSTASKYGDYDITGDGAMEFFTRRRKITTKWRAHTGGAPDIAQFK